MIWFLTALVVAIFIDRVQLKLGADSYRSIYNGQGAIDSVNKRTAKAPMAYRVLVPWIIGGIERFIPSLRAKRIQALYEPIKVISMFLLIYVCGIFFGYTSALLLAALMGATFFFDYWDWTFEAIGVLFALTGNPYLFLIGTVLWALSKETAPLAPFIYMVSTGDVAIACLGGILCIVIQWFVKTVVGKRELYCQRVMYEINKQDVKELFENTPFYSSEIFISLCITVVCLAAVLIMPTLGGLYVIPLLVAGWVLARAAETRVFFACLIYPCIVAGKLL